MSNIGSYEKRKEDFSWDIAKEVMDWKEGEVLNIGSICSDRVCARGNGDKKA